jgi:hypothetical protein
MNKNIKPNKALVKTAVSGSTTQVKLGEIFECEGVLYSITISNTITGNSNLEDGRSIFKFIKEYCH